MSRTTPCLRIHESIAPGGPHAIITNVLYGKEDESLEQKDPAGQLNPEQREKNAAPEFSRLKARPLQSCAEIGGCFSGAMKLYCSVPGGEPAFLPGNMAAASRKEP